MVDSRFLDAGLSEVSWRPRPHGAAPRISALYCYPVKGCAPVALTESLLTSAGLRHDRSFMVISAAGGYQTQRRHPRMARIRPEISADGTRLVLEAPEVGSVDVRVDVAGSRRDVDLFGAPYQGIDQGDVVAGWLSETLGVPSRLVRVPPDHNRVTDGQTPGTSGYADSCPVHVVSEASLESLNHKLRSNESEAVPMSRFRPNIVLSGHGEPHLEDRVHSARIGAAELGYAKLAIRCVVTTVDQALGTKSGPEPLRTLATYRRATGGGVAFGAKFAVTATSTITVGDTVTVDAWRAPDV